MAALTAAIEVLSGLLPSMGLTSFGECVRTMRADPELRALFKARYATKTARGNFPGIPSMLTDPFCLESKPSTYWFDADTCEKLVCAFIARQTLNRRRALLDVHESGVKYSLRGHYGTETAQLKFLTAEDAEYLHEGKWEACRYYIHPIYEYRKSVRKLTAAEVIVTASTPLVLDVDMQTGDLINCFEGYKLTAPSQSASSPPYLVEAALRVEMISESEAPLIEERSKTKDSPLGDEILNQYTLSLIKRVTPDQNQQVAMNRALTQYFRPHSLSKPLSGWAFKYDQWIHDVIGDGPLARYSISKLTATPEEKLPPSSEKRDIQIATDGPFLNALLAVWMQAQIYVRDLSTDVETYIRANTPQSLRDLPREPDGRKPAWQRWASTLPSSRSIVPKQLIDSWSTVWKLLELTLQCHNDPERSRITYHEFIEAMPVKVYANYEAEFESLKRQAPELSEVQ